MTHIARKLTLITLLPALVLLSGTWNGGAWTLVATTAAEDTAAEGTSDGTLAKYVAKPDDSYRWIKHDEGTIGKASYVELILTSQTWRNIPWKHQLYVIKPSTVKDDAKHGLLIISGGAWRDKYEQPVAKRPMPRETILFAALAEQLGTPVAVLLQVPQQPLFDGLKEDALIATTFENFIRSKDPEWPLLLPMAKSAVRAMDAVTELTNQKWGLKIDSFTVTGASKRGWTTWLTAAIDDRVTALAPIVIDMLNMHPQLKHQIDAWGDYSPSIHDYTDRGLHKAFATETGKELRRIVDPYEYRHQLNQPKLIILGTNDSYWPLDALNLYWDDLPGDKYILYVPNEGHGIRDLPRVFGTLTAFHRHAAFGQPMPKLTWQFSEPADGPLLEIRTDIAPSKVSAWVATSSTRDFRDAKWRAVPCNGDEHTFRYQQPRPEKGYAAFFGEAQYQGDSAPYHLSTNVTILGADDAQ